MEAQSLRHPSTLRPTTNVSVMAGSMFQFTIGPKLDYYIVIRFRVRVVAGRSRSRSVSVSLAVDNIADLMHLQLGVVDLRHVYSFGPALSRQLAKCSVARLHVLA